MANEKLQKKLGEKRSMISIRGAVVDVYLLHDYV